MRARTNTHTNTPHVHTHASHITSHHTHHIASHTSHANKQSHAQGHTPGQPKACATWTEEEEQGGGGGVHFKAWAMAVINQDSESGGAMLV